MTKNEALKMIDDSPVRAGQRWQHCVTRDVYLVTAVGLYETTLEPVVNYTGPDGIVWTRELVVFLGENNGQRRFTMVEETHGAPSSWRPTDGFEERPS